jgi:hypothetical protein
MKTVEVRPSQKFAGAWIAFDAPGVEPAFATNDPKADAINYARGRFGGSCGEIHVYDDAGTNIIEKIVMDGRTKYTQAD